MPIKVQSLKYSKYPIKCRICTTETTETLTIRNEALTAGISQVSVDVAPGARQILLRPAICIPASNPRYGRILAGICISPRYTANYREGGGKLMGGTPINWQLSCPRQWRKLSRPAGDSDTHSKDEWLDVCRVSKSIRSAAN